MKSMVFNSKVGTIQNWNLESYQMKLAYLNLSASTNIITTQGQEQAQALSS